MRGKLGLISHLVATQHDPNRILLKLAFRRALLGCKTVLDVGCGKALTLRDLGVEHSTGVDGYAPDLEAAKQRHAHNEYVLCDVRRIGEKFQPKQFDGVITNDVIEHLPKADGLKLIADMERIARKRVVIFTPCGFLPQGNTEQGDLQAHHSGWEPEEMEQLGYRVTGQLGPKSLRGEYHCLKHKPAMFWGAVSFAGQILSSENNPKTAAAILAVKTLGGE